MKDVVKFKGITGRGREIQITLAAYGGLRWRIVFVDEGRPFRGFKTLKEAKGYGESYLLKIGSAWEKVKPESEQPAARPGRNDDNA